MMAALEPCTYCSVDEMSVQPVEPSNGPPQDELDEAHAKALIAKRAGLIASFSFAINGMMRTLCTQRNMKIHWISGLAVMLVGMALELDIAARASVMFCVGMLLCMEVLNTALEAFVDLHIKQYARTAMIAKDAAAAAVLIFAIAAVVVFADILLHRWSMVANSEPAIFRTVLAGVPLLIAMGLGLFLRRSVALLIALGFASVGLVTYLAYYSRDEVFSLGALSFILAGFVARFREPRLSARV